MSEGRTTQIASIELDGAISSPKSHENQITQAMTVYCNYLYVHANNVHEYIHTLYIMLCILIKFAMIMPNETITF